MARSEAVMPFAGKAHPSWEASASRVAKARNADIFLFSGGIYPGTDNQLTLLVKKCRSRQNVILMLTTMGGSPDTAYRIARCLREEYKLGEFILIVDSDCKSAGTLIALGAHKIVMSDEAELGPLDVQVYKEDEVGEMASGLTPIQALATLRVETFRHWEDSFGRLRYRHALSTRMAAQIAARMSIGLFRPIYEQIDPMRLGENQRAMMIGYHYGHRIKTDNVKDESIDRLLSGYPSHSFVIDRTEAKTLFSDVKSPTADEHALICEVKELAKEGQANDVRQQGSARIVVISTQSKRTADTSNNGEGNDTRTRQSGKGKTGAGPDFGSSVGNGRPKRSRTVLPATSAIPSAVRSARQPLE